MSPIRWENHISFKLRRSNKSGRMKFSRMMWYTLGIAIAATGSVFLFRKPWQSWFGGRNLSTTGMRTKVKRDEFYRQKESEEALAVFFNFNESRYDGDSVRLKRMWTCSATRKQNKLIFLHIPRSAGSTVRALLKAYAEFCHAGIAVVNRCFDVSLESMIGVEAWRNGKGSQFEAQECLITFAANRTGETILNAPIASAARRVSTALINYLDLNILAGQLPIGIEEYWNTDDKQQEHLKAQYVIFFRQPLQKFVSEIMFRQPDKDQLSIDDGVALVYETAVNRTRDGKYHDKYSNYMITPQQKDWVHKGRVIWTPERRMNLTLTNLYQNNVLVGIVERMPESVKLMQHILDGDNEVPNLFQFFSSFDKVARVTGITTKNRTDAIVERIQQDSTMLPIIDEFLKYENKIYDHALHIHLKQLRFLEEGKMVKEP